MSYVPLALLDHFARLYATNTIPLLLHMCTPDIRDELYREYEKLMARPVATTSEELASFNAGVLEICKKAADDINER